MNFVVKMEKLLVADDVVQGRAVVVVVVLVFVSVRAWGATTTYAYADVDVWVDGKETRLPRTRTRGVQPEVKSRKLQVFTVQFSEWNLELSEDSKVRARSTIHTSNFNIKYCSRLPPGHFVSFRFISFHSTQTQTQRNALLE
jgi:hypothetical protein